MTAPATSREIARIRNKRWYYSVRSEAGHWIHLRLAHASAIGFAMRAAGVGTRVLMKRRDGETEVYLRLG